MADRWLRIIHRVAAHLRCRSVYDDGLLCLLRYPLFGWRSDRPSRAPFSLYLHRFMLPDQDTATHSHPWSFAVSLVLAGGYTEERLVAGVERLVTRHVRPGRFNFITGRTFHRVSQLHGPETWSVILLRLRRGGWGFHVPGRGFVPWKQRRAERVIEMQNDPSTATRSSCPGLPPAH
jgi:hypothetical protein